VQVIGRWDEGDPAAAGKEAFCGGPRSGGAAARCYGGRYGTGAAAAGGTARAAAIGAGCVDEEVSWGGGGAGEAQAAQDREHFVVRYVGEGVLWWGRG